MCGIAGLFYVSGEPADADLHKMTGTVRHRGPDAEGFFTGHGCGLGHRRLSIIDLNERSNQPMWSANGRYVMIYNGEVYNYNEIGMQLLKEAPPGSNFHLKTTSDSEVVLEAFARYGESFVELLNGMFALAIFDTQEKALYLVRDRIGIKPLYYIWKDGRFAFASEIKALRSLNIASDEYNRRAVSEFMQLGFVPAPLSIYEDIHKLPGGCMLKVDASGIKVKRYWDLQDHIKANAAEDENQVLEKLSDLLMSSIQYQLRSDVPFGVFLSGGIDSSLITAQAVMLSNSRINTFSIGFEESRYNESKYAHAVADYLGTDHHEFIVTYKDAINLIGTIFDTYDEPFADSSAIPTMLVSKLAREHVTVTLSGEGGDELFFGYGSHHWARRLGNPMISMLRFPVRKAFAQMSSRYRRVATLLDYSGSDNLMKHIFGQEQYLFTEAEANTVLSQGLKRSISPVPSYLCPPPEYSYEYFDRAYANGRISRKLSRMEMQAFYDINSYLQDDLLTKVDRASMRYSLETRVPYLDHRIVEFAVNVSSRLKYHNGVPKYILKEILHQYLPERLFNRPKQGFAIPLEKWLREDLKFLADEYLNEETVSKHGVFEWPEVKILKDRFYGGENLLYNRVWALIVVLKWFENQNKIMV